MNPVFGREFSGILRSPRALQALVALDDELLPRADVRCGDADGHAVVADDFHRVLVRQPVLRRDRKSTRLNSSH